MDAWNTARLPGFGMSYFNRTDLPYYYALADAFTISDQYYQVTVPWLCPYALPNPFGPCSTLVGSARPCPVT